MLLLSMLVLIVSVISDVLNLKTVSRKETVIGTEIDYAGLAGQAETHKEDVLGFLNQSNVQEKYKELYQCLLDRLLTNVTSNRRGSTRRIVSGHNTSISAVPWQMSLREKSYPICGGSVVTDLWGLTAAHCLLRARASDLSVRIGSSWKTHGGEMYDVKESYVHPRYSSKTKMHDVGLVRLYSALRFSATVLPIRVVAKHSWLLADQAAVVSGWGKLKEGGLSAVFLQSSTVKTIAMKLCKRSGLERKAIDPASMFCAGSFTHASPDACQGDSGGPIVHDGVLIGVVSWGLGCARGNFPGVYTRLAQELIWDWVHDHIAQKSGNTI